MPPKLSFIPLRQLQWHPKLPLPFGLQTNWLRRPSSSILCSHHWYLTRTLSSTSPRRRSAGGKQLSKNKTARASAIADAHYPPSSSSQDKEGADALDFSEYEAQIATTRESLKAALAKVRLGGLDVEGLEQLRIRTGEKGRGGSGEGEGRKGMILEYVASVMKRGRNVIVMVSEKEYLKPVMSALQSSSDTIQPQMSPTDPLHIHLPIPPTTAETRTNAAKECEEKGHNALHHLNQARAAARKRLQAMKQTARVGPDEFRRAEKRMEEINRGAEGEAKKLVEDAKGRLMKG